MSISEDHCEKKTGENSQPTTSQNETTNNVSKIRTIKVSNVSLCATENDVKDFFSFCGEIVFIETQRENETTQLAFVTFKDPHGAETAMLLSGAVISNLSISINPAEDYQLPPHAPRLDPPSAMEKAEEVASTVLAKGLILGKDALNKAKSFDEKHQLTSNASAAVASVDRKMGISEKLILGAAVASEKAREVNDRYRVSDKARAAVAQAEQTAATAGSALACNRYVSAGATLLSSAIAAIARTAGIVSAMTAEKVRKAEEERLENETKERASNVNDLAQVHLDHSSLGDSNGNVNHHVDSDNDDKKIV